MTYASTRERALPGPDAWDQEALERPPPWGMAEVFIISQVVLPALLYLPGTQSIRFLSRVGSYGISLAMLCWWIASSRRQPAHPSQSWLLGCVGYVALMVLHPTTNTLLAGLAQTGLYLAVLAPIFWAPALVWHPTQLWRILILMLAVNALSSIVGILQVYDPNTWLPTEFSHIITGFEYGISAQTYIGSQGQTIIRPPGLGDAPGAVCAAGNVTIVIAFIFFAAAPWLSLRVLMLFLAATGFTAIYFSHVRTSLLIACGSVLVYFLLLFRQGRSFLAIVTVALLVLLAGFGLSLAESQGGESVLDRFSSLTQEDPLTVYEQSGRLPMLLQGFESLLPQYPLGAGLGRWGMMRYYFGDPYNRESPLLWSELQIPSWILDGGIVLLVAYMAALYLALREQYRMVVNPTSREVRDCAAAVLALNAGTAALIFGYTPFTSPIGMQFWFLAGALHGIANNLQERAWRDS